jgi:hypothetical protein
VPTTRPRHLVTETEALAAALDEAAERWPGLSRPQLLVRLALHGSEAAATEPVDRGRQRLEAVRAHSGALTGIYGPDYVAQCGDDWVE